MNKFKKKKKKTHTEYLGELTLEYLSNPNEMKRNNLLGSLQGCAN